MSQLVIFGIGDLMGGDLWNLNSIKSISTMIIKSFCYHVIASH